MLFLLGAIAYSARIIAFIGLIIIVLEAYLNIGGGFIDEAESAFELLGNATLNEETIPLLTWLSLAGIPGAIGILLTGMFFKLIINVAFAAMNWIPK